MDYYDFTLLFIPSAGIIGPGILRTGGLPLHLAVCIGSIPVLLVLTHALFIRTPTKSLEGHHETSGMNAQAPEVNR